MSSTRLTYVSVVFEIYQDLATRPRLSFLKGSL
eukprot:SAG11_NODE_16628_length_542_cov_0.812641_1_plen_32_part_01